RDGRHSEPAHLPARPRRTRRLRAHEAVLCGGASTVESARLVSLRRSRSSGRDVDSASPRRRAVLSGARAVSMNSRLPSLVGPRGARYLAIAMCACVGLLGAFTYRAMNEWQRSATMLAERRAQQGADLLAAAFTRDMRAAQNVFLSSQEWYDSTVEGPAES